VKRTSPHSNPCRQFCRHDKRPIPATKREAASESTIVNPPHETNHAYDGYNPEGGFALDWQQEATFSEGMSAALLQSDVAAPGGTPIIRVFHAWP
jgi:hypothetical protein